MSLVNTLLKNLKYEEVKKKKDLSRTRKNTSLKRNRFSRPRVNSALPAAYISHVRSRFNYLYRGKQSCVVQGSDLVYSIPSELEPSAETLFAIITANPAYWKGTRISMIAPAYMNYRPISFKVSYIPQVSVTQAGTVFMGTLWNSGIPTNNIQQTLITSNGGLLTQCYVPADSVVSLGANLPQHLFQMSGSLNLDTNPFTFLAGVRGSNVVPGYFYVSYRYEFRNPIGESWTYFNSGLTTLASLPEQTADANATVILLSQQNNFGPGTQIDRESNGLFYHGSPISLDPQTPVIYLNNFQTLDPSASRASSFQPIVINKFMVGSTSLLLSDFSGSLSQTSEVEVPIDNTVYIIEEREDSLIFRSLYSAIAKTRRVEGLYYVSTNRTSFGIYSDDVEVALVSADNGSNDSISPEVILSKPYFSL